MFCELFRPLNLLEEEHGASRRWFSQDSDGYMESVLDAFVECGLNCVYH